MPPPFPPHCRKKKKIERTCSAALEKKFSFLFPPLAVLHLLIGLVVGDDASGKQSLDEKAKHILR